MCRYEQSKAKAHADDEARARRFEVAQRKKREEDAAARQVEKGLSAEAMALERQRAVMAEEEEQAWYFQHKLKSLQKEKKEELFSGDKRDEANQAKIKKQEAQAFEKELQRHHKLEERRQAQQAYNAKVASDVLMEQWEEEKQARLERRGSFDQRSRAMRNAAIGKNEFRKNKEMEVAEVQNGMAAREQAERATNEQAAKQRAEAERASREAQAQALREAERIKAERAKQSAAEHSRQTKKKMRAEATKQEAEATQHQAAFTQLGKAQVHDDESKRQGGERTSEQAHADDEARARRFEVAQRKKREEDAAARQVEKGLSAEAMALERQRAVMAEEEEQAWYFQHKLKSLQKEKKEELFSGDKRDEANQAKIKKQEAQAFEKELQRHHKLEERRQAQQAYNAKVASDVLMEQWEEEKQARLERRGSFDQRSRAMRNAAIGKNEFRKNKEMEVAEVQNGMAAREQAERATNEQAAKQRAEAERASREAQAQALREAERIKAERAKQSAAEHSRQTKKKMRAEATKQEAEATQHQAAFTQLGKAQVHEAEAKRLEEERTQAAIQRRQNKEMDRNLKRMQKARHEYAEASSPTRSRSSSPLHFMPGASPTPSTMSPM